MASVIMYHGTSLEAAMDICAHGFVASSGGLLGCGVYLSASITKASRYAFSKSSHGGAILEVEVDLREDESIVDVDEVRTNQTIQHVRFARIGAGCDDQEIRVRDPSRVRARRCYFGQRERAHEIGYRMAGDTLTRVGPVLSDRTARAAPRRRRVGGAFFARRVRPRAGGSGPGRNSMMEGLVNGAEAAANRHWRAPILCGLSDECDGIDDKQIAFSATMPEGRMPISQALLGGTLPGVPFVLQVVSESELVDGVMIHQHYSDGVHRTPRVHMPPAMPGIETGVVIVVQHARLRRAATIAPFFFNRGPIIEVVKARICCGPRPCKRGPDGGTPRHLEPTYPEIKAVSPRLRPARPPPYHSRPGEWSVPAPLCEVIRRIRENELGGSPGGDERGPYAKEHGVYLYDFETGDKRYTSKLKDDVEAWNAACRDMGAALICREEYSFGMLALSTRVMH